MVELEIVWGFFKGLCAAVVMIGGAGAYIEKFILKKKQPTQELKEKAEKLEEELKEQKRRVEKMEQELKKYADDLFDTAQDNVKDIKVEIKQLKIDIEASQQETKLILNSLLAIGNHIITNDSADKIKESNDSIVKYLINKT